MYRVSGRVTVIVAAFLMTLATVAPIGAQSTENIVLRSGDRVLVEVWNRPEMSGQFEVTPAGGLAHPLLSDVRVAGRPFSDAQADLRRFLERFDDDPRFVALPLVQVSVFGEVRSANLYRFSPELTIPEAIAQAGGFTPNARTDRIRVIRDGQEMMVDLTQAQLDGEHLRVRSGDQIQVDRDRSIFRDYIAPAGSITGALVGLVSLLLR